MVLIPSYNIRKKIEKWQYFIYCTTRELQTYSFRHATDASKHPHATGPGQPAPVGDRRETLRRVPSFVVAQEMELVGQRTRDDEAAALALIVTVGASGEPPLRRPPPRCLGRRGAGGGDEVVVHRPSRRPPLLDRAVDERDEPLHPHLATISAPPIHKRPQIEEEIFSAPSKTRSTWSSCFAASSNELPQQKGFL